MRLKAIKVGKFYETTHGTGEALQVGGTHPPAVKVDILAPIPMGVRWVKPREVLSESIDPRGAAPVASAEDPEREERLTRRTKFIAEGCETIADVTVAAAEFIRDLCKLSALGFELTEPVSDGYLHLEKQG